MRRFFTEPENITGDSALIYEDAAHITRVLRMKIGDSVLIFDGSGKEYTAELCEVSDKCCRAKILSVAESVLEPRTRVTIYQSLPKSGKMEEIIQKSVELGAYSIVPVAADRCVTKLDGGKRQTEKLKRWNKVAVSAAKQCGRGILPTVQPPMTFKAAVDKMKQDGLALMPYEVLGHGGVSNLKEVLTRFKTEHNAEKAEIGIIIGPEGGFSDSEAEYAESLGINFVGLGNRILRTETVSCAMLGMVMYELGEI